MPDEIFMHQALEEARKAFSRGEVPIGAVLVYKGEVIARAHNLVESLCDPTAHAEVLCIRKGAELLNNWRLLDTVLYCTLEPCPMCAGAMIHSRIDSLIWGARDVRCGAHGSWVDIFAPQHPIHQVKVKSGVLAEESSALMKEFFKMRRQNFAGSV